MNKELRIVRGVLNALTWTIIGMTIMAFKYSGIGWDTVLIVFLGLAMIRAVMHFDPSFKER